jgi:hypothetical protein
MAEGHISVRSAPRVYWLLVLRIARRARAADPVLDLRRYRRRAQATMESSALISSMVVRGKKNLKPGRSMTMSPGK